MKNVDTSLGEAPSIAERLRWGGSHGTALYFLLTVSTFQGIDAAVDALLVEVKGCHYLFEIAVLRTIKTF